MSDADGGDLGLTGAVSIALGGMIGGGREAVLGVAVNISGLVSWAAFTLAGMAGWTLLFGYVGSIGASPRSRPRSDVVGSVAFPPLMLWNEFPTQRSVFYTIVGLAVVGVAVELIYFGADVFGPAADEDPMADD